MMLMVMMDDTAVGDGWSIDDYDAVLFICVGLLLCAGDIVAESGRRQLISFANSFSVAVVLLLFLRGVGRSVGAISK